MYLPRRVQKFQIKSVKCLAPFCNISRELSTPLKHSAEDHLLLQAAGGEPSPSPGQPGCLSGTKTNNSHESHFAGAGNIRHASFSQRRALMLTFGELLGAVPPGHLHLGLTHNGIL